MERKKILLVEDEFQIVSILEHELDSFVEIVRVRAVDEALGAVEEDGPFHCYVVDLQIIPKGLTFDEIAEYQNMEGYAFLKKFWEKGTEEIAMLKSKTIICSGFIPEFKKEYQDEIKGLFLVEKKLGYEKTLVSIINRIIQ